MIPLLCPAFTRHLTSRIWLNGMVTQSFPVFTLVVAVYSFLMLEFTVDTKISAASYCIGKVSKSKSIRLMLFTQSLFSLVISSITLNLSGGQSMHFCLTKRGTWMVMLFCLSFEISNKTSTHSSKATAVPFAAVTESWQKKPLSACKDSRG